MYILFALIAILFVAVIITVVYFPHLPLFEPKDKLPIAGVVRRLELKSSETAIVKCKVYPQLLKYEFERLFSRVQKKRAVNRLLSTIQSVKEQIISKVNTLKSEVNSVRKCENISKIFAFCYELISYSRCDVSIDLLEKSISVFFGQVSGNKRNSICTVLDYCLLCAVLQNAKIAERISQSYLRGVADGKCGNADISAINDTAYVMGLYNGFDDSERASLDKLLEVNGNSCGAVADRYCKDVAQLFVDIVSALSSLSAPIDIDSTCEGSYFNDNGYKINVLQNSELYVSTDNRGKIYADYERVCHNISLWAEADNKRFDLTLCDGVMQPHRTVYRSVIDNVEFAAEAIVPFDLHVVLISVRTLGANFVRIHAQLNVPNGGNKTDIGSCIAVANGYCAGLCVISGRGVEYCCKGNDFSAIATSHISSFEKNTVVFAVAFSQNVVTLERIFDMMRYENYFEKALYGAYLYSDRSRYGVRALPQSAGEIAFISEEDFYAHLFKPVVPTYLFCDAENAEYELLSACGGFLPDGSYFTCSDEFDGEKSYSAALREILGDNLFSVSVALGCGDKILLPFLRASVKVCAGCVELSSYNEDGKYSLKIYKASRDAEIYDLSIDCESIDNVMFMFESHGQAIGKAVENDGEIFIPTPNGGIGITCSHGFADFTPYKEGYSSHGVMNRTRGFRIGGINSSPAVSVDINKYNKRIILCVERFSDVPKINSISSVFADDILNCRMKVYSRAIKPLTFDKKLNYCYTKAFEIAHENFTADGDLSACFAEKYVDPSVVRERIVDCFKNQRTDGAVGNDPLYYSLVLPILVDEYVKRSGDERFWSVEIPYCDGMAVRRTVLDHCLCAIVFSQSQNSDIFSANLLYFVLMRFINKYRQPLRKKQLAFATTVKSNIDKCVSEITSCESIEQAEILIVCALFSAGKREAANILDIVGSYCSAHGGSFVELFGINIALLYGFAEYGAQRFDKGYDIIREATDYFMSGTERCGVPRIVRREISAHAASLYYVLVTEKLFGISMIRNRTKLDPCIARQTPHIEFEIPGSKNACRIVIDDGEAGGSWRLRMGRITCASNVIGDSENVEYTLFKNEGA